ncbi:MAG: 30S ribosome-binding factor RbfA [Rhodothermales bacterium]|nr:30S ribosome-binding factor RbfA [Rhodothermales bacterium]
MSIRTERVARLLQREIAGLLVTDYAEQLQGMVTVTGTRVTKDLGIVYTYVSVLGDSPALQQASFERLEELQPRIRKSLASRIRHQLKKVPEIRFFLDSTLDQAQRIEDLFEKIRDERSSREHE